MFKPRERAFKQFKWRHPQCVKNIRQYGSVSLFVIAIVLLHFGVCLSQCTGQRLIQNGCWNSHIHCRHMDTTFSPLLFGEVGCSLTGCYGVSCAWPFVGSFVFILVLSSHNCQLCPCWSCIQTRCWLLCSHAWTVLWRVLCLHIGSMYLVFHCMIWMHSIPW